MFGIFALPGGGMGGGGVTGRKPSKTTFKRREQQKGETGRLKPHGCWLVANIHSPVISLFSPHPSFLPHLQTQIRKQWWALPARRCLSNLTDAKCLSFFISFFSLLSNVAALFCARFLHFSFSKFKYNLLKTRGSLLQTKSKLPWKPCQNTSFLLFLVTVISFVPVASDFFANRWGACSKCQHLAQRSCKK